MTTPNKIQDSKKADTLSTLIDLKKQSAHIVALLETLTGICKELVSEMKKTNERLTTPEVGSSSEEEFDPFATKSIPERLAKTLRVIAQLNRKLNRPVEAKEIADEARMSVQNFHEQARWLYDKQLIERVRGREINMDPRNGYFFFIPGFEYDLPLS
ncbi:MAG: hypothetical protein ACFFC7_08240 [Candidatus Hermodarchaeota archaeon]